jgi:hypothetical protein
MLMADEVEWPGQEVEMLFVDLDWFENSDWDKDPSPPWFGSLTPHYENCPHGYGAKNNMHSRRAMSPVVICAGVRLMPATEADVRRAAAEGAWAQQIRMNRYNIPAVGKEELTTCWNGGRCVRRRSCQPASSVEQGTENPASRHEQLTNPSSWGIQGLEIQQGAEIAVECFS